MNFFHFYQIAPGSNQVITLLFLITQLGFLLLKKNIVDKRVSYETRLSTPFLEKHKNRSIKQSNCSLFLEKTFYLRTN